MSRATFKVLIDTREQQGWEFAPSVSCLGSEVVTLPTGDYSIAGHEARFVIERKGSVSEWARNVMEKRFERELERLDAMSHPFIFLEFTAADLLAWPNLEGVPWKVRRSCRVRGPLLLKRTLEIQLAHRVPIWFVGDQGREIALSLFKRIAEGGQG